MFNNNLVDKISVYILVIQFAFVCFLKFFLSKLFSVYMCVKLHSLKSQCRYSFGLPEILWFSSLLE